MSMNITVIGPGRWGSFIAWYLNTLNHNVKLYGRSSSLKLQELIKNDYFKGEVEITSNLNCLKESEIIVISINSQGLRKLLSSLKDVGVQGKKIVLCMKGLEIETGFRLTQIVEEILGENFPVATWIGPGHVQEFQSGIPNCMVIDSKSEELKEEIINAFGGKLIRFYYGQDLIGNEIGAAAKNVIGIAAGILDGLKLSTLKGALMSRGTREIARLIKAMGGNENSAYGLCHLGDYEATVFSKYSHNREFGEKIVKGESYTDLAEGYYTVVALIDLAKKVGVDLPICKAVYSVLYENQDASQSIVELFSRTVKEEFYQ